MRRCRLAVVCACLLIAPSARAQESLPVTDAQKEFESLIARVKQSDPTVDFARLRRVFSESDAYRGRDDAEASLIDTFSAKAFEKSLTLAREILGRNYLNFNGHYFGMASCLELKDETCAAHHRYVAAGLMGSIARSGDGKTPETAWVVVATSEEYAFLGIQGLSVIEQALMGANGHNYDRLKVRDQKTKEERDVYFNVDLSMAALKRMLSAPAR